MKIGNLEINNTFFLAPMAGVSDYPFRTICRDYGCNVAYSEMVSSEGLVRGGEKTISYLYKGKEDCQENHLIAFQIFGSDPDTMAEAALEVEQRGADIIDINMGCPVKKVVKTMSGSALMSDLPRIKAMVTAVKKKITVPLTVKIRAGWENKVNAIEVARLLEECGTDALIIHPRTQKQAFSGKADWNLIRQIKEKLSIPVVGNGDVQSVEDYNRMKELTSCDAVMVGRGAMGQPWIFKLDSPNYRPDFEELKKVILKHYRLSIDFYGERRGVREMRKHLSWYTKGLFQGNKLRSMINELEDFNLVLETLEKHFQEAEALAH